MRHDVTSVDNFSDNDKQGSQTKDIYHLNVFSNRLSLARSMYFDLEEKGKYVKYSIVSISHFLWVGVVYL